MPAGDLRGFGRSHQRKLIPALYELHLENQLPERFAILGVSRSEMADAVFRERMATWCAKNRGHTDEAWSAFQAKLFYHAADAVTAEGMHSLKQRIGALRSTCNTGQNLLLYLSLMPQLYDPVIQQIGASGLVTEGKNWCSLDRANIPWQRVIVEKPFGHDLASASHLNRVLGRVFDDDAIYCIDHYLGKETVQNLLVFRFANAIFEPLWNRQYIDHVQIAALEKVGVEGRGAYFDQAGAMRDMIQSHLLQLMAAVAMEPPNSFKAADMRTEQRKALEAVRMIRAHEVADIAMRGQYEPGEVDGAAKPGYLQEKGVDPASNTESYAALKLSIDNWRWQGVPFYLRTGKAIKKKLTQIVLYFKPTPHCLFNQPGGDCDYRLAPNRLVINVQPDEGISLRFEGKVPGQDLRIQSAIMDFDYVQQFGGSIPEAYAHLLQDAMRGDQSLFKDRHEIEAAWRIVTPVLDHWKMNPGSSMQSYPMGSWGPNAAERLFAGHGHWHNPEGQLTRYLKKAPQT